MLNLRKKAESAKPPTDFSCCHLTGAAFYVLQAITPYIRFANIIIGTEQT